MSDQNTEHSATPEGKELLQTTSERIQNGKHQRNPRCCKTIHLFLVNYCFLFLFYMTQSVYNVGVMRTLERKFGLSSAQSGLIMSINDVSHIVVVVFVGYFGKRGHKPKFLSSSLLIVAVAVLLMASPKLFFDGATESKAVDFSSVEMVHEDPDGYSSLEGSALNPAYSWINSTQGDEFAVLCGEGEVDICDAEDIRRDSTNRAAYFTFLAAQFLAGLGGSGITTFGMAYIDENSQKHESALYLGIVTSMFAIGPISGLGLSSLTLRLPESLLSDPDMDPRDVNWIGCWWLGYLISSVGITICCIPMWFFPKHILVQPRTKEQLTRSQQSIKEQLKDFPREMLSLVRNAPYMVYILQSLLMNYVLSGLFINLPRYFEVHFHQPAYKASFIAVSSAVSGIVGGVLGGFIMKRKKIRPYGASKFIFATECAFAIGIAINMNLKCPQLEMAGLWKENGQLSVALPCNENCTCSVSKEAYKPTCGEDGLTYFSACHAGCTTLANGTYSDCGCVVNPENLDVLGSTSSGQCPISCKLLIPYIAVFFVVGLVGSIGRAPSTVLQLRIVGTEQKAFALAITSFVINLLGFIPAPIVFGTLIDSACILWQTTCSASGTGSCLLYDSNDFRLIIHGIALLFKVFALIASVVLCILVKRMKFSDEYPTEQKDRGDQESQIEKQPMRELLNSGTNNNRHENTE